MHPVQNPEQALIEHPVAHNDDEKMDSVQHLRADPVLDQVLQTYPTNQINLVQINHHVQVERAGQVLMVQVPDRVRVSDLRGPGKVDTGNRGSGQVLIVDAVDRQRELEDQR